VTATVRAAGSAPTIDEAQILDAVQASLRALVAVAPWPRALADVATDVLSEPMRVLGGRLMPWALVPLCCCTAACGDWRPALPAAVAAELYATALDLCDDLEDGDRSEPIERHGPAIVLNLSTALLALTHSALEPSTSHESVACRRAQDALWEGLAVATGGQHLDLAAAGAAPLPIEDCLDIARRKGGALVEACCRAGAAFATADPQLIELFGRLGRSLGLVGQLDNDMHDAGDSARKSDLARRKQTVPIAVARSGHSADNLSHAVWHGGIQLAYALVHAERARAQEALDAAAAACPDPSLARAVLAPLLVPRGRATP
jgi:geranylgeranyl pyrophosphate synthase